MIVDSVVIFVSLNSLHKFNLILIITNKINNYKDETKKETLMFRNLKVILSVWILVSPPLVAAKKIPTPMQTWLLQSTCDIKATRYAKGFCEGAIEAYFSLMPNWCIPDQVAHGEVKRYVMSKIQQAPKSPSIRVPAEDFIRELISKKYPCK